MTKYTTLDEFLDQAGIKAEIEAIAAALVAELEAAGIDSEALDAEIEAIVANEERVFLRGDGGPETGLFRR